MRILQVVTLLSPDGAYGGPVSVALNQAAELLRRGHQVTVAAGVRGYAKVPTEVGGVPVTLFDARTLVPKTGFAGLGARGLTRWFRRCGKDFDVVHIHFGRDLVVAPVALAARRMGLPYVLQPHGMVIGSRHPLARPVDALCTRPVLRGARKILCLTEQEREQVAAVGGPELRFSLLRNGVPEFPSVPRSNAGVPEVLFAARLHPRKRPVAFVEMARRLLAAGTEARFVLIGPDEGEGRAVREAIAGESRISWQGSMDHADLPGRLAKASIFVLPSIAEPYPMAVLEAMSVGVPVVIADDCGLAPLIEGAGCGLVVDHRPQSLAAAVEQILGDPERAATMAARGRETARTECGMDAVGAALTSVYEEAVA